MTAMFRSISRAVVAVLLFATTAATAPISPPYDLYEAGPLDGPALAGFRAAPGSWLVLQQERLDGRTWLLLALPDGRTSSELPGWGRPRYLGRVREGERVIRAAPDRPGLERLRTGRSLSLSPSGSSILVTTEPLQELATRAHQGFEALERTVPLHSEREAGPIESFRATWERARRATRDGRTPEQVAALRDQVSADSLEVYVRTLSERASMQPTSRYFADPRTEGVHRDYIQAKLAEALGPSAISNHAFRMERAPGDTITIHNVIGKHASSRPNAPAVFVTAHYDAIGTLSNAVALCEFGHRKPSTACDCSLPDDVILADPDCAWDWELDPAPGADDNATGVAAMFEMARILAGVDFDFDIYYVAFQGEELGLIGSAAFVDSVRTAGQDIVVDFNMDMLGYNAFSDQQDVITNEFSEWFADWIVETAALFVPALPVTKIVEVFGRSDHARFWNIGADAVLLFEDIDLPYPGYHSFLDLWETVFPGNRPDEERQFELAVRVAVCTLARFALQYDAPDLAIPAGELEAAPVFSNRFEAGRPVRLTAIVHNFGNSSLTVGGVTTDSLTARVSFYDGDPDQGGTLINQVERREFFGSGSATPFEIAWLTPEGSEGFHDVWAVVEGLDEGYVDGEVSSENNRNSITVFLEAPLQTAPTLLTHYVFPNPVTGTIDDIEFYYELTRTGAVEILVHDVSGQLLGRYTATSAFVGPGNRPGANQVRGREFRWEGAEIESGVYLYSIRVRSASGADVSDVISGKFALVR